MRTLLADRHTYVAGLVTAIVGFTSAFAVVLTGLRTMGATRTGGIGSPPPSPHDGHRDDPARWALPIPITIAWSTPERPCSRRARHLPAGGRLPSRVRRNGLLIVATAAIPALGTLIARIPTSIAQAMLAGVIVPLCLKPSLRQQPRSA